MSTRHAGNMLNQVTFEEHEGDINAKRTSLVSAATIYAVVNTGAAGVQNSMTTLNQGPNFIGLVTVHHGTGLVTLAPSPNFIGLISVAQPISTTFSGNVTLDAGSKTGIAGNVTLSDSKGFIGLVSVGNRVDLNSNVTLNASPNFIGLVSIAQPISTTFSGNVTLDAGSKTGIAGNVTLSDSKGFIGLVSVAQPISTTFSGNVTLDAGSRTGIAGNVTLSDSKGYVGLVTVGNRIDLNSNVTLNASANYIGLASVNIGGSLPVGANFIGLATVTTSNPGAQGMVTIFPGPNYIGLATVDIGTQNKVAISGNVTLSDPKTYVGLVTATSVQGGNWDVGIVRGNVTVEQGDDPWNVAAKGNVTLSDAKTYIGLTTTTLGVGDRYIGLVTATSVGLQTLAPSPSFIGLATVRPDFGSNVTVHTQVFSATGNTTIFVAPASNRFFLTNLHVASLGRAEIEIRSGATTLIPFTGLATTGGYAHNFGQPGLPSRAQADALVANLNGAATVSIMASWYAQP